jgi:Effector-associated domain 11
MVSKEILHNWLANNQLQAIFDNLLARNPIPDMVIHTSGRYHAYMGEKMEGMEESTSLRVEYNRIRKALEYIINQLAETPSLIQNKNHPMTGLELLNDLLVGVSGNAAYDKLKALVQAHQPISPAERETFEKLEALLDLGVRNVKTQTEMLVALHDLKTEFAKKQNLDAQQPTVVNNGSVTGQFNDSQFYAPIYFGKPI